MNKANPKRRWRLVADPAVQGWLCLRIIAYWVICQISILGTMLAFQFLENGSHSGSVDSWNLIVRSALVSFMVVPVIVYDTLCFSNRFVGPVLNLRKKLKRAVETGEISNVEFREGDFYPDLSENINELICQLKNSKRINDAEEKHEYLVAGGVNSR